MAGTKLGKTHWSALPFRDFSSILVTPVKQLEDWLRLPFHLACQGGQFPQSIPALPHPITFVLFPSLCGTNNITKARGLRSCLYLISNHFLHLWDTYIQSYFNTTTEPISNLFFDVHMIRIWLEQIVAAYLPASWLDITTSPVQFGLDIALFYVGITKLMWLQNIWTVGSMQRSKNTKGKCFYFVFF